MTDLFKKSNRDMEKPSVHCQPCIKEFRRENCCFDHSPAEDFVRSQWQSRSKNIYYLLYRYAIAIFFIACVIESFTSFTHSHFIGKYFIYLTNWGILMCLFTAIYGALLVSVWYFMPNYSDDINQNNEMPISFKIYWCVHNITLILSIIISLIYWTILHNSELIPLNAANVLTHGTNSVTMVIDILIVAYPIRMYHVIQPICFGLIYVIFSGIYYACGGTDMFGNHFIYNVLDWSKPEIAFITMFGTILLAIVVHTIIFFIIKLRILIYKRHINKKIVLPTTHMTSTNGTNNNGSQISMVLGQYDYNNEAFKGSTEKF